MPPILHIYPFTLSARPISQGFFSQDRCGGRRKPYSPGVSSSFPLYLAVKNCLLNIDGSIQREKPPLPPPSFKGCGWCHSVVGRGGRGGSGDQNFSSRYLPPPLLLLENGKKENSTLSIFTRSQNLFFTEDKCRIMCLKLYLLPLGQER